MMSSAEDCRQAFRKTAVPYLEIDFNGYYDISVKAEGWN